jgi:hypothetical protein
MIRRGPNRGPVATIAAVLACGLLIDGFAFVGFQEIRHRMDQRQQVSAARLDVALQTFRPSEHAGLAKLVERDELAAERSVRSEPDRCSALTLLATGSALDAQSWTGADGVPLQPVSTLTVRFVDADAARDDLLAKRVALLRCRAVKLTFPPFDQPAQLFDVTGGLWASLASGDVVRYSLRRGSKAYGFYVRRYANTVTWSYADDVSSPEMRQRVVDSLVVRLQQLSRE